MSAIKGSTFAYIFLNAMIALPAIAGSDYILKYDKFENSKLAKYALAVGSECVLKETLKSTLYSCDFFADSSQPYTPTVIMGTLADDWDIRHYTDVSPYSDTYAPALITFKDGVKKRMQLPAIYQGSVVRGNIVMEFVSIRLGELRRVLFKIESIEVKYGSNEYCIKLDELLTRKALSYQK